MNRLKNLLSLVFITGLVAGCASPPRYVIEAPNAPLPSREEVSHRSIGADGVVTAYQEKLATVDVRDLDTKFEVISMPLPDYPLAARARGIEGIVRIRFVIGFDGKAEDISLVRSAHPMLNSAAVSAVEGWRFKPMKLRGTPVRVSVEQEIPFVLAK